MSVSEEWSISAIGGAIARLAPRAALVVVPLQLAAIIAVYQVATDFTCIGDARRDACSLLRSLVGRAIVLFAAMALYAAARRPLLAALLSARAADDGGWRPWAALQIAGFAAILAPAALFDPAEGDYFAAGAPLWLAGAAAASAGALLWLAPLRAWLDFLRAEPLLLGALVLGAMALPPLAQIAYPLWTDGLITRVTFAAVAGTLDALGAAPTVDAARYYIAVGDFAVEVGPSCSGVQGFFLVTAFVGLYAWIFRADTRFPAFWLVLPAALAVSWTFNVLRIVALVGIGAAGAPDLAVNGFHSHAGWLFFTLVALGVMAAARSIPALRVAPKAGDAAARRTPPPLSEDWSAAQLLPFVVFMASALLASTLVDPPALAYPLRALAMIAALWPFRALYRRLDWRLDPVSLAAGVAIGALWLATAPPPAEADSALADALAALGPAAFALWVASRLVGTALLVPLIEELVFRGYVLRRLDTGGIVMRALALAVSSALFAALHDRWLAAALAGLVFGLLTLRSGRLTDAVLAHAAANAVIAAWAAAAGDWHVI
jgi:exosortase E/protease (VPEID-CTERM system)